MPPTSLAALAPHFFQVAYVTPDLAASEAWFQGLLGVSSFFRMENVAFGAGPRASQGLILGAKARAILHGRYAAELDDVRALIEPILMHRLVMNFRAEAEGVTAVDVIEGIMRSIEP